METSENVLSCQESNQNAVETVGVNSFRGIPFPVDSVHSEQTEPCGLLGPAEVDPVTIAKVTYKDANDDGEVLQIKSEDASWDSRLDKSIKTAAPSSMTNPVSITYDDNHGPGDHIGESSVRNTTSIQNNRFIHKKIYANTANTVGPVKTTTTSTITMYIATEVPGENEQHTETFRPDTNETESSIYQADTSEMDTGSSSIEESDTTTLTDPGSSSLVRALLSGCFRTCDVCCQKIPASKISPISQGEPFKCEHCRLQNQATMDAENQIIQNQRKFRCTECSTCFTLFPDLIRHVQVHTDKNPPVLKQSGSYFLDTEDPGACFAKAPQGNFWCKLCHKVFIQPDDLDEHMVTFHKHEVFICEYCNEYFIVQSELEKHKSKHLKKEGFHCRHCGKYFPLECYLQIHMRTHTGDKPFKCEQCGKCFSQKGNLKTHTKTHSAEKPFKCGLCGKSYVQKANLQTHIRTHTGERPFKCDFCSKCFNYASSLKHHLKTHSDDS